MMKVYSGLADLPNGPCGTDIQPGCLVVEGGAFRGLYNQGILDAFLAHNLNFQTVIGVSAGALAGANYVSGQIGRSARLNLKYRHDPRYIGIRPVLSCHSIINLDFLLETCNQYEPLDTESLFSPNRRLIAVATNCLTGQAMYYDKDNCSDMMKALKASASMPYISPMVEVDGVPCLDGGCSDKIPYRWALEQNFGKIVVLRTRERTYRKPDKEDAFAKTVYRKYPDFAKMLQKSNRDYNIQCEEVVRLEQEGRVFVIAPNQPVRVKRIESDMEKLGALYWQGYRDAEANLDALTRYLNA